MELVETCSVEHLETIAQSFHGLAALDPDTIDLLAPTSGKSVASGTTDMSAEGV